MILYPTETIYGLGVNPFDEAELGKLFAIKGREASKVSAWLVRTIEDIERYAEVGEVGAKIAKQFLPGQLTLILPAKPNIPEELLAPDKTLGFRISGDPKAAQLIESFMTEHDAPLTCTSANVSGSPTFPTVAEILQQFGPQAHLIDEVIDDGPRKGLASTVVKVIADEVTLIREGIISEAEILATLK